MWFQLPCLARNKNGVEVVGLGTRERGWDVGRGGRRRRWNLRQRRSSRFGASACWIWG
uniref:Uncharacterized protein n=1 Tax=Triticum urartu TaxID=4572 RepID=A0A8R7JY21_TRIUA